MFPTHLEIAVNAYIKRALLKTYIYIDFPLVVQCNVKLVEMCSIRINNHS